MRTPELDRLIGRIVRYTKRGKAFTGAIRDARTVDDEITVSVEIKGWGYHTLPYRDITEFLD